MRCDKDKHEKYYETEGVYIIKSRVNYIIVVEFNPLLHFGGQNFNL